MKECALLNTPGQICRSLGNEYCFLKEQIATDQGQVRLKDGSGFPPQYITSLTESKGCPNQAEIIDSLELPCKAPGAYGDFCQMKQNPATAETCFVLERFNLPPESSSEQASSQKEGLSLFTGCPYLKVAETLLDTRERKK